MLGGEPACGKGALLPEAGGQPQGPGGGRSEADGEGEGGAPEAAGAAGDTAGEQLSGQPGQTGGTLLHPSLLSDECGGGQVR